MNRMWEIREGYSYEDRDYDRNYSRRMSKHDELEEAYEEGFECGYKRAMKELREHPSYAEHKGRME